MATPHMLDTVPATPAERHLLALTATLLHRLDELARRVADLEEWLGEVADDALDREGVA